MKMAIKTMLLINETHILYTALYSILGPTYNEFRYYEHSAVTINYFSKKRTLLIDINVKKVWL